MEIIKKTDHLIENKIVQAFILSDQYIKNILYTYKKKYMQNKYFLTIVDWCIDYYQQYEKAPKNHITDIFDLKKGKLKEDEYELIQAMLQSLSDSYDNDINFQYFITETEQYFKIRSYQILGNELVKSSQLQDIKETEQILTNFKSVQKELSGWIDPFDPNEIRSAFESIDSDNLFRLPGKIGDLLGWFKRGYLFGVLAPPKKGKTTFLQEIAFYALMSKLKVLFISLEMNPQRSKLRLYKRLTALSDKEENKIPIFDCEHNQKGTCDNANRRNKIKISRPDGSIDFNKKGYKICDYCRKRELKTFLPAIYFFSEKNHLFEYNNIKGKINQFKKWIKPGIRYKSYPPYSVKLSQIINDIKILEDSEGFIPDVIIPDYFAICAPENNSLSERGAVDSTWKLGKQLAEERQCLVATGHQGNRSSIDSREIRQTHASEDIRIMAHCDAMVGISQTEKEKEFGIIRANKLVSRDDYFVGGQFVSMLCNLSIGQFIMDSELGQINL